MTASKQEPKFVRDCPHRKRQHDYMGYKQGSIYYWSCKNPIRHGDAGTGCDYNGNKKLESCRVFGKPCLQADAVMKVEESKRKIDEMFADLDQKERHLAAFREVLKL